GLEECASKTSMPGRVRRERWGKVRAIKIAGGSAERRKIWIARGGGIAVTKLRWSGSGIGFADASHRPPILIKVFRLPNLDAGVGHGYVHQSQQPRQFSGVRACAHLIGDMHGDLVVQTRRRAEARCSIVGPEDADLSLFGCSRCRGYDTIAAD